MEINKLSRRGILKFAAAAAVTGAAGKLFAEPEKSNNNFRKEKTMDINSFAGAYENGQYMLPELPYEYDALEPLYDEETLRIHHDKHHAKYVKNFNEAVSKLEN